MELERPFQAQAERTQYPKVSVGHDVLGQLHRDALELIGRGLLFLRRVEPVVVVP